MRKTVLLALAALSLTVISCSDDNDDKYADWRNANTEYYLQQTTLRDADGSLYFTTLRPTWNTGSGALIHYFNDRSLTAGNYSPLETSTVAVKYKLSLYDGTPVDSSYNLTDSLYYAQVSKLISGWQVALNDMHVGDTCKLVLPYYSGYANTGSSAVPPYSTLVFDIKLVDIPSLYR